MRVGGGGAERCGSVTYLSSLVLLCAVVQLIDLMGKLVKVRDDEFLFESLSQQHDVVPHTPTRGHTIELYTLQLVSKISTYYANILETET